MRNEGMDALFTLLWLIVVPIILVSMIFGRVITAIVLVGVTGFYLTSRAQVRATVIQAAAIKEAADIQAAAIKEAAEIAAKEAEEARKAASRRPTTGTTP
jgi:nitrogen regulatory protein PII-like uncharacterized protein